MIHGLKMVRVDKKTTTKNKQKNTKKEKTNEDCLLF